MYKLKIYRYLSTQFFYKYRISHRIWSLFAQVQKINKNSRFEIPSQLFFVFVVQQINEIALAQHQENGRHNHQKNKPYKSGILTRERINTKNLNTILSSELLLQCRVLRLYSGTVAFILAYHGSAIDYTVHTTRY